jgi:glycosyltransferase involved in cell wall biosynthesis
VAARCGARVRFAGRVSDAELRSLYHHSHALVFPANEDFGIVPVEAAACGTPVVALDAGGSCDTVLPGVTGVLAADQSLDAFAAATEAALQTRFAGAAMRRHALSFSHEAFRMRLRVWVDGAEPVDLRAGIPAQPPAASDLMGRPTLPA